MAALSISRRLPMVTGYSIPQLGYGVYQTPANVCASVVLHALKAGYRHVDTAAAYRNEHATAAAFAEFLATNPSIQRSDLFYTTKLPPKEIGYTATVESIQRSLAYIRSPPAISDTAEPTPTFNSNLKDGVQSSEPSSSSLEYIDLYLIHAPTGDLTARNGSWKAMVEAQKRGEIRSLGVSNYGVHHLAQLEEFIQHEEAGGKSEKGEEGWGGKIAAWQGEVHPWLGRKDIREWCAERGVVVEAYCPIVRGTRFEDPLLEPLVEKYGKTAAQILLRWSLQMGFSPMPKSVTPERIDANADIFDFELTDEEVKHLDTGEYKPCAWDPTIWKA